MAKDNPILPTPAGRKQVVVVEEKGWERRNASVSLPGAGTGKGRRLHSEKPKAEPGEIPLCVVTPVPALPHNVSTFCSDSPGPGSDSLSGQSTAHRHWRMKFCTLGFTSTEIPYSQTGTLVS